MTTTSAAPATQRRQAALGILQPWQTAMREAEAQVDALQALMGINPEAPLFAACYALMGLATRQAAQLSGVALEWLEAWHLESNFGDKPLRAGLADEPLRSITTLSALVDLIIDDEETAQ